MATQATRSDVLPEALADALLDAEYDPFRTHARYKYLEAFVDRGATSQTQVLTRSDVEAYLETTYPNLEINSKKTSHDALQDLVNNGFLERDTQTQTYRYWLVWSGADGSEGAQCDSTAETDGSGGDETVNADYEGTVLREDGTVAPGERDLTSAAASTGSATTAGWVPSVRTLSQSWVGAWATLFVLFAGGSVAFITVLLARLAVPSPVVTGSAAVAWGLLSLGLAAGIVLGLRSLNYPTLRRSVYRLRS